MLKKKFDLKPLRGYPMEYGLMLAMLEDGTREWREELKAIGPDGIVWQPVPGSYSIGGILLHIAEVEVFWIEEFCLGRKMSEADETLFMSKEIDQYKGKWPTPPRKPLSYYYSILDDVRGRTLKAVRKIPSPKTLKERRDTQFSMAWVLAHVVEHESYHGGQIVMLKELYRRREE